MKIIIIGSGNVATVLGKAIINVGHIVLQVYSRSFEKAMILGDKLAAEPIIDLKRLNEEADIFLIALSDTAISEIVQKIHLQKGILVHTAGAVPMDNLQNAAKEYGVLYPLQSLRKEKTDYQNIPLLIDGSSENVVSILSIFAKTITNNVAIANDEQRLKLHVSAVVVSNFTNYLYALTEDYCKKENIPFEMLYPIIGEVANRLQNHHAADMQTGPAIRKDFPTMEKHLALLNNYPDLKEVYAFLSQKIINM